MRLFAVISPQVFVSNYPADDAAEHSEKYGYEFIHGAHSVMSVEKTQTRTQQSDRATGRDLRSDAPKTIRCIVLFQLR